VLIVALPSFFSILSHLRVFLDCTFIVALQYKDVLTLKYVQEFSSEEIAKILDISEATVRKRLERAKRRLEEILGMEESADVN
jgi:RNA polymerase sigma factor (sigma-70 family)